jgi:hypothetical protein
MATRPASKRRRRMRCCSRRSYRRVSGRQWGLARWLAGPVERHRLASRHSAVINLLGFGEVILHRDGTDLAPSVSHTAGRVPRKATGSLEDPPNPSHSGRKKEILPSSPPSLPPPGHREREPQRIIAVALAHGVDGAMHGFVVIEQGELFVVEAEVRKGHAEQADGEPPAAGALE